MRKDNTIKKDWFVFANGTWFNSSPKDEKEKDFFDYNKDIARQCGLKVVEICFDKTEYEFHNRFNQ